MRTTLIYDLPTRIFHWTFSGLFLFSFVIAKTVDDESVVFSYHMLSGLLIGGIVLWRIFWGLFGSQHARFTGFNLNPMYLKDYFLGILSGSKKRWSGHNPASSWAAITMFVLAAGLATTGYLMSTGSKEAFEDLHEFMANAFVIIVILHIAGVILHVLRHRDALALSMIDGKKELIDSKDSISSSNGFAAILFIAFVTSSAIYLANNFNIQNRTLNIFGQTLQLGESENENESENEDNKGNKRESEQDNENESEDEDEARSGNDSHSKNTLPSSYES